MNGYFIIGFTLGAFILGLISGGYITYDHMQAKQLTAVDKGIADYKQSQSKIAVVDTKAATSQKTQDVKTNTITKELTHVKSLTDCKLDTSTIASLHNASIPAAGVSR